jgi:hypothetical protein
MKCVKNVHTNEIKRVSDEQANRLVMSGGHYFTPKSEWKALRVKPVEVIVHTDEQKREIQRKADKRKNEKAKKDYRKQ